MRYFIQSEITTEIHPSGFRKGSHLITKNDVLLIYFKDSERIKRMESSVVSRRRFRDSGNLFLRALNFEMVQIFCHEQNLAVI